jgi:hypothetical protein
MPIYTTCYEIPNDIPSRMTIRSISKRYSEEIMRKWWW